MHDNDNLSEEKLKELQRKEVLSDSEEYDIQDRTYNDAPLTRQYILDEQIVGGSELVDEEKKKKQEPPVLIVEEDDDTDNVLIISDQDLDPIIEEPEPAKEPEAPQETEHQDLDPKIEESDKDYIDRDTALTAADHDTFEPVPVKEKKPKETKRSNERGDIPRWLKWAGMIFGFIFVLVLCVLLYLWLTSYVSKDQELSAEKKAYIEMVNKTNQTVMNEDAICKEFVTLTENLMLDIIDADTYREGIVSLSDRLQIEISNFASYPIENTEDSQIKAAIIDYIKNTRSMIDQYAIPDQSSDDLKLVILNDLNQDLDNRDLRHSNLVILIYEQAAIHEIDADQKDQIVMFDIDKNGID